MKFKDVIGYEGLYSIGDDGTLISKEISIARGIKTSLFKRGQKVMKPKLNIHGRYYFSLTKDRMGKNFSRARLVATHFVDNPLNKKEVNHIDGDRQNDHFSNLEWATRKENQSHAFANGLIPFMPKNHPSISKTIIQIKDGVAISEYPSTMEAVRVNGFCHSNISNCLNGKKFKAHGYEWRFKN